MRSLLTTLLTLSLQSYAEDAAKLNEEGANASTAPARVEVGDKALKLMSKYPKNRQDAIDLASDWYGKAWPDLEEKDKAKLRMRLERLYAPSPPLPKKPGVPGWGPPLPNQSSFSSTRTHSGLRALRFKISRDPGLGDMGTTSVEIPRKAKKLEAVYWILTDGTDRFGDKLSVGVYDREGKLLIIKEPAFMKDTPVWTRYEHKIDLPEEAYRLAFGIMLDSSKGEILVDDISAKVDGKEIMGTSFER